MLRADQVLHEFEGNFSGLDVAQRHLKRVNHRWKQGNAFLDRIEALPAAAAQVKAQPLRP